MDAQPDEDLRARRWATVQEHIRCERLGTDIDGAVASFADGNATYDVVALEHLKPPNQELTHPDAQSVRSMLSDLTTAFPDLELVPVVVHHSADAVIVEGRTQGTHLGELHGLPPTGRRMDMRGAVIYRFDGDRMTNETLYFDLASQMRQLGLETLEL